jgi:alpha-N-acetylglucosamine transferase
MEKFAYVTLLLNSEYLPGTLTLCESLKQTGTKIPIILLVSKSNISIECYDILQQSQYFERIVNVDSYLLETRNEFQLVDLLKRSDLSLTLTKLNVWGLTDYDRIVYLDSDMLIYENIDCLFKIWDNLNENDIIASSDSGWPDIFNSGLFVIKPNNTTFKKLLNFYETNNSFDGADQGILNEYFNLQSNKTGGNWYRLPFIFNCTLNSNYEYLPAMIRFKDSIKAFHFIGLNKPWKNHNLCYDQTYAKIFNYGKDNLYQLWWNKFNSIKIGNYSSIEILELSGHLQSRIEYLSLDHNKFIQESIDCNNEEERKDHDDDEKSIHRHVEIINPFLSPELKPQGATNNLHFPTFYYKKPNSTIEIKDETNIGEAWKMSEGKVEWPKNDKNESNIDDIVNSPIKLLSHLDKYIRDHPIFPWEQNPSEKTQVTRTFKNTMRYEPPVYSISVMNLSDTENAEEDEHNVDKNDDKNGNDHDDDNDNDRLVGFDDGSKFEKYLNKIENLSLSIPKEDNELSNGLSNELDIEQQFDEDLEKAENSFLDISENLADQTIKLGKEDAKIEDQLDDDDNDVVGRIGHV